MKRNEYSINPEEFIQFHSEDERELFVEARLGQEAINFLSSPLGQLLQGRAEQDRQAAMEELLEVNPRETSAIENLQNKAHIANQFICWIGEAIQNGHHAEQQLEEMTDEE